jgi:hypothetical protein
MKNNPPAARPLPPKAAQIAAEARAALARVSGAGGVAGGGVKLPLWPIGALVEIAPGVKVAPVAGTDQARVLVLDLEPQANGTFRPVARVRGKRVRLTRDGLPALGISAGYKTMRRLIAAGFVRGEQPAPGVIQMDLESYFEHERATADPEFWTRQNGANVKKLRLAVAGTSFGSGGDNNRRKAAAPIPVADSISAPRARRPPS